MTSKTSALEILKNELMCFVWSSPESKLSDANPGGGTCPFCASPPKSGNPLKCKNTNKAFENLGLPQILSGIVFFNCQGMLAFFFDQSGMLTLEFPKLEMHCLQIVMLAKMKEAHYESAQHIMTKIRSSFYVHNHTLKIMLILNKFKIRFIKLCQSS